MFLEFCKWDLKKYKKSRNILKLLTMKRSHREVLQISVNGIMDPLSPTSRLFTTLIWSIYRTRTFRHCKFSSTFFDFVTWRSVKFVKSTTTIKLSISTYELEPLDVCVSFNPVVNVPVWWMVFEYYLISIGFDAVRKEKNVVCGTNNDNNNNVWTMRQVRTSERPQWSEQLRPLSMNCEKYCEKSGGGLRSNS